MTEILPPLTIKATSDTEARQFVGCYLEDIYFLGHSHVQKLPEEDKVELTFRLSKSEAENLLQKIK